MREIQVKITCTFGMHNMNMADAITKAIELMGKEQTRVEIIAHEVFRNEEIDDD